MTGIMIQIGSCILVFLKLQDLAENNVGFLNALCLLRI